jgi:hypothetical protein
MQDLQQRGAAHVGVGHRRHRIHELSLRMGPIMNAQCEGQATPPV